jgi:hypothetical protein
MGDIKRLLDQRHPGRQGRPAMAKLKSTAKYQLSRNYTIANLQTALAVYDLWLENQSAPEGDKLVLWQIGQKLGLSAKAAKKAVARLALDRAVGRNHLSVLVKRYLNEAVAHIESVAQGVFPAVKVRKKSKP